jgi:hypothetical protein
MADQCNSLKRSGERGRNRTFNLLIKSLSVWPFVLMSADIAFQTPEHMTRINKRHL